MKRLFLGSPCRSNTASARRIQVVDVQQANCCECSSGGLKSCSSCSGPFCRAVLRGRSGVIVAVMARSSRDTSYEIVKFAGRLSGRALALRVFALTGEEGPRRFFGRGSDNPSLQMQRCVRWDMGPEQHRVSPIHAERRGSSPYRLKDSGEPLISSPLASGRMP